ncbi:pyridoxal phosphate-dependent aminotransferase [Agromyces sp. SYSU K20354]|uniref:pyridoxal phosphate-dependent aminotransferase n=1 Tax=Agromyces cavernae TaxID=2898659 RepID=UPI001E5A5BAD|nr:pyridoxal phosphate-dependent aminotransferase [Agromyces cavernae]MCD2442345.1 pyridoxal phosphate-dependent aminotransferase [Agromyces cavernae]
MRTRPQRLADVAGFNIDRVADAAGSDPSVLRLENLDTDLGPPTEAITATIAAAGTLEANSWLPFTGKPSMKEAIAARVAQRSGVAYDPATEVVVNSSDGEALLDALLALVDQGDEVVLTDPTYAGLLNRVRLAGAVPRLVPLLSAYGEWRLDLDALERAVSAATRAILVANPAFPTGIVLSDAEWVELARLCVEHDIWLIYWAWMEGIVFDGRPIRHPASLPGMRERTIIVGSASCEQRMIGWRLGWIVAPEAVMPDLSVVQIYNGLVAGGIAQAAGVAALTASDDGLTRCVAEWQRRRDVVGRQLAGLPMIPAAGGWSQLVDTRALGVEPAALSRTLIEHGVAATPMTGWGGDIADRHLRIVFSREPEDRLELLGDRFAAALRAVGAGSSLG